MSDDSSSISDLLPPDGLPLIEIVFHELLLRVFLVGLYTFVTGVTLYAGCIQSERSSNRRVIFFIVFLQYAFVVVHTGVSWWELNEAFVKNDSFEMAEFVIFYPKLWVVLCRETSLIPTFVLADCLLIWRCWTVWNRDWRVIVFPVITTMVEAAMFCLATWSKVAIAPLAFGDPRGDRIYHLGIVGTLSSYPLTVFTTLLTTSLIVYRICSVGNKDIIRRHMFAVEIIVESAVLYTIPQTLNLIWQVIPATMTVLGIVAATALPMGGIAPMLLVARVYLGFARPNVSWVEPSKHFWKKRATQESARATSIVMSSILSNGETAAKNNNILELRQPHIDEFNPSTVIEIADKSKSSRKDGLLVNGVSENGLEPGELEANPVP